MFSRKVFLILFLLFHVFFFSLALFEYQGNKLYYISFSISSLFFLVYLTDKNSFFYENFISVFLYSGIWLNFSIKITFFDSIFPEGVGFFDYKPSSYDEVIYVCTISFLSIIFASFIRRKIFSQFNNSINNVKLNFSSNKILFCSFLFLLFTIIISFLNYKYSIHQRSLTAKIDLNFFISNFLKWFLIIGCTTFFAYVINLLIDSKNKLPKILILFHLVSEFIINISMLSRGMIFNSLSVAWGILQKKNYKNDNMFKFTYLILIFCFFFLSIKIVGDLRIEKKNKFHKYCNTQTIFEVVPKSSIKNSEVNNKYLKIFLSRLIGIEGVMAVQSLDNKGFDLIKNALKETTNSTNGISFFDSLKNDQRCTNEFSKSITLPGIIAFLYYSGSLVFVAITLFLISILMCSIEKIMRYLLKEQLLFISLISQILAYRMWHFGFAPLNSIKLLLAIFSTIFLVYLINKFFKIKQ